MAKLVDAADSKSAGVTAVPVRVRLRAPFIQLTNLENWVRYGSFFSTNRNEFQHIHQYNYIHQNDYIHYVIKKSN